MTIWQKLHNETYKQWLIAAKCTQAYKHAFISGTYEDRVAYCKANRTAKRCEKLMQEIAWNDQTATWIR